MHIHEFARNAEAAVNAHDVDAVAALWVEPAHYESPLTGFQEGIDALRQRERELFAGFSDITADCTPLGQEGDTGAMLVRFIGSHDGTYAGVAPTGRQVTLEMVAVLQFDPTGRVRAERVFLDAGLALAQLAPQ